MPTHPAIPPELALVLTLCLLPLSEQERERAPRLAAEVRDWDEFTFWTMRHGVLGSVLANIKSLGLSIPPATLARLAGLHRQASLRDMQLIAALGQVQTLFAQNGLDFLTIKGPALSQLLFASPFVRHSIDLDILVPAAQVARAEQALLAEGYAPLMHKPPLSAMQFKRYLQYSHHFLYRHPKSGISLELHWALREPYIFALDHAPFFERAQVVRLANGLQTRTLADPDALLHAILHGALHHWNSAKHFRDLLALLARDSIDFEQLVGIITTCQLSWPAAQGLQLSREIFGRELPAQLGAFLQLDNHSIRFLKNSARRELLARDPEKLTVRPRRFVYDSRLQPGPDYARRVITASWLAPHHWHALPLPDGLFSLYFLIVPLVGSWKKMQGPLTKAKLIKNWFNRDKIR
ncbi:MAG: nucleotidyltransferase family protein [Anaerolineae bacterium]|nr:nucleotidyltransferase family protein [Anaerolineae bacterium]